MEPLTPSPLTSSNIQNFQLTTPSSTEKNISSNLNKVDKIAKASLEKTEKTRSPDALSQPPLIFPVSSSRKQNDFLFLTSLEMEKLCNQYGYKAVNLMRLVPICASLKNEGGTSIHIEIPSFKSISHDDIAEYLHLLEIDDKWEDFKESQKGHNSLTLEGKEILSKIRKEIEKTFEHPTDNSPLIDQINSFIVEVPQDLLMVRSTGRREDSDEGALAGGNVSIAGVPKDAKAILRAIGSVVASYFSEKSIGQRLISIEEIVDPPFMPVLLQVMIGEKPGSILQPNEMFCSGVAYSKEMGGETPDLTVINATYGNCEAVVNFVPNINNDTYYVSSDGINHEVIPPKRYRLVAQSTSTGKTVFKELENPPLIQNLRVLNKQLQSDLHEIAKAIQEGFGKSMDIEWVYNPSTKTIYIVQARPIVQKITFHPATIEDNALLSVLSLYEGKMIVDKGGEAVMLNNPKEVIIANNLEVSLNEYLKLMETNKKEAKKIKAIVVVKNGSSLSHPACVFRENGIPVICCSNFKPVSMNENKPYVLDTQRGMIAQFVNSDQTKLLKDGWFKSPIPAVESLKQDIPISDEYLREFSTSFHLEEGKVSRELTFESLSKALHDPDVNIQREAIRSTIVLLFSLCNSLEKQSSFTAPFLMGRLKTLLLNAMVLGKAYESKTHHMQRLHIAKRFEALLKQEISPLILGSDSLLRVLEDQRDFKELTLPNTKLSQSSEGHLLAMKLQTIRLIKLGKSENEKTLITNLSQPMDSKELYESLGVYSRLSKLAFTDESKQAWKFFTDSLVSSKSRVANAKLLNLISELYDMGILGEWMNDQFLVASRVHKDPIFLLQILCDNVDRISPDIKEAFSNLKNAINKWGTQAEKFSDLNSFIVLWPLFQSSVIDKINALTNSYIQSKDKLSDLENQMMLHLLLKGINLYDKCIKNLRSTPHGDPLIKVEAFMMMLIPYKDLMIKWLKIIPDSVLKNWYRNASIGNPANYKQKIIDSIESDFHQIFKNFQSLLSNEDSNSEDELEEVESKSIQFAKRQLTPQSDFNILGVTISSGSDFYMNYIGPPEAQKEHTLEELFMLFHQNLLSSVNCHKADIPPTHFPKNLQMLLSHLDNLKGNITNYQIACNRLDQQIEYPIITTTYNIPVQYHSIVAVVVYDCNKQTANLNFVMLGHNLHNRMNILANMILWDSVSHHLKFDEFPLYDEDQKKLAYSWRLSKDMLENANILINVENLILKFTVSSIILNVSSIEEQSPKKAEELNKNIWDVLLEDPSILQYQYHHLFGSGTVDYLSYAIEKHPEKARKILEAQGIMKGKATQDLLQDLLSSFIAKLKDNLSDGTMRKAADENMTWHGLLNLKHLIPADLSKGLLFKLLDKDQSSAFSTRFYTELLKNLDVLKLDPGKSLASQEFNLILIKKLTDYLISHEQFSQLSQCCTFFENEKQLQCLVPIYNTLEEKELQITEKIDPQLMKKKQDLYHEMQKQQILGVSALSIDVKNMQAIKKEDLKIGDKVLIQFEDKWFYGEVGHNQLEKKFSVFIRCPLKYSFIAFYAENLKQVFKCPSRSEYSTQENLNKTQGIISKKVEGYNPNNQ